MHRDDGLSGKRERKRGETSGSEGEGVALWPGWGGQVRRFGK